MEKNTEELDFFNSYDANQYERPNSSVDIVIFSFFDQNLHVLTVQRDEYPFKDQWSLVGGYIDLKKDLTLEAAAQRKLEEKTGVIPPYLEQVETIGSQNRDPRGWSITTVYFALVRFEEIHLKAEQGVSLAQWSKITHGKLKHSLAFDHTQIFNRCLERFKNKVLYTSLPTHLMPSEFTLGELQEVYESILGKKIEQKGFRRRMLNSEILEETQREKLGPNRPAKLYRLKRSKTSHYFSRTMKNE
jgi:ADP-ribose pyrophosphatase YjhB (NUDIX family)